MCWETKWPQQSQWALLLHLSPIRHTPDLNTARKFKLWIFSLKAFARLRGHYWSPSPTLLQFSQLAVQHPQWCTGDVPPWVETIATGYSLRFKGQAHHFCPFVDTVVWNDIAAAMRTQINNLLNKTPIQVVLASEASEGWYSCYLQ